MPIILGGTTNTILTTTWANKPASYPVGQSVFMSNVGPKGSHWWYDGTRWKPTSGSLVLASLDSASSSIGNTEVIGFQYLLPAGLWQVGDIIRINAYVEKSGTTDSGIAYFHFGTAGTTSDTAVLNGSTWMSAANKSAEYFADFRLESATSVQQVSIGNGLGGSSSQPTTVTVSSVTSNAVYFSLGLRSNGSTDTVLIRSAFMQLFSKAN